MRANGQPTRSDSSLSEAKINGLKQILEARRRELTETEQDLEDEALIDLSSETTDEISHFRTHPADLGSDEFGQQLALQLADGEIYELQAISDALERINTHTYGSCEECGSDIPYSRLEVLPYARYCVSCESRLESLNRRTLASHSIRP
jgi:RNA polymerase-binding protein DksA